MVVVVVSMAEDVLDALLGSTGWELRHPLHLRTKRPQQAWKASPISRSPCSSASTNGIHFTLD